MKLFKILLVPIFVTLILGVTPVHAQDTSSFLDDDSERIEQFNVDIEVQENGSVVVTEQILYDFGTTERHGIIREIPVAYDSEGYETSINAEVLSVTDENEAPLTYTVEDYYYTQIRIGDADLYVSGPRWYYITYRMDYVINGYEEHDELYWNVTGNEWSVPILGASASVTVPALVDAPQGACFTGVIGATGGTCTYNADGNTFRFNTTAPLSAYEGLSIVAGFNKGIVTLPASLTIRSIPAPAAIEVDGKKTGYLTPEQIRLEPGTHEISVTKSRYVPTTQTITLNQSEQKIIELTLEKVWWAVWVEVYLPIALAILFTLGAFLLWYRRGRDPKKRTVIAQYEAPEGVTPGEMGVIIDEKAHLHDITATIIDLAVSGYITIKKDKDSYILVKKADLTDAARPFETLIMDGIFSDGKTSRSISSLKNKFYTHLPKIKKELYKEVVNKKYFTQNPDAVRSTYFGIGVTALILGVMASIFFVGLFDSSLYFIPFPLLGLELVALSFIMPKKTKEGMRSYEYALGLKEFFTVTAKERLKMLHSPAEYKGVFEKFLPYAMVLGVEELWADQFKDLYKGSLDWYEGDAGSTAHLMRNLSSMNTALASNMVSAPSSSGSRYSGWSGGSSSWSGGSGFSGGYSGGGFGGGGGSSW